MEFIYDCLVVARTYYGAFYLKPVYNRSWRCVCTSDRWRNLVEGCENGAENRRKYDTRKHLEDACTGVNSPKTSKRMQVDVILPWKVRSLYESLKLWIKGKVRWLFGLICLSEKELPNRLKDTLYPRGWYCRELRCDTNIKHWWMINIRKI